MKRAALAGFGLVALTFWLPATVQAETYTIIDRQGFDGPTPAVKFQLPNGWKARGSIRWYKPCSFQKLFVTLFRATSADGRTGLRMSPGFVFNIMVADPPGIDPMVDNMVAESMRQQRAANAKSNCLVQQAGDLNWLAEKLVVSRRPAGTRLVSITRNKQAAETLKQAVGGDQRVDPRDRFSVEVAAVRVTYDTALGPVDEDVALQVIQQRNHSPPFNGVSTFTETTSVFPLVRFWAPRGRLDSATPVLSKILASGKEQSQWAEGVSKLRAKNAEVRRKENEDRNKRWADEQRRQSKQNEDFISGVIWGSALQTLSQTEATK